MQRSPRAPEYTIIFEIRPTRSHHAAPFPHSLGIPSGIFHETHRRERGSPVNSPGICVYERATLESGLTLEDPRLGTIDRQLNVRICRVVGARVRTRVYTGVRVRWCHSYISLESRWNLYARRPTCYYISCHRKIRTSAGRPFGVAPERRSWDPRLRCAIVQSREKSLDTIYIFFAVSLSLTLLSPLMGRLPSDMFLSPYWLFSKLALFLTTNLSSCCRTFIYS